MIKAMSGFSKQQGNDGEDLAVAYLKNKGYHILERQWRYGHLEVDIICEDPSTSQIVFVEVKTRADDSFGNPLDAIDRKKMMRLSAAANHYIRVNRCPLEWRFDVIGIILHPYIDPKAKEPHALTREELEGYPLLEHIPDAFYPPLSR